MNDPIKKFVQQHRQAFDHLEPPIDGLERLQGRLRPVPNIRKGFFQRYPSAKWLVAASLLIGALFAFLLSDLQRPSPADSQPQVVHQPAKESVPAIASRTTDTTGKTVHSEQSRKAVSDVPRQLTGNRQPEVKQKTLATRLADSSSASTRLAAILDIEQSGLMDDRTLTLLTQTMNHDGNTNVRLAALDVLGSHLDNPAVIGVFKQSLTQQDDPLVQLGLIKIAGRMDNLDIEKALFALAENPNTFIAVRDEAYAALLKSNKL